MKRSIRFFGFVIELLAVVLLCSGVAARAEVRGMAGPRGGEVVRGPMGNTEMEGPRGTIAIGSRYNVLPDSATIVFVQGQNYYVDDNGVYYLPCADDGTVYCVVPAPQND